MSGECDECSWHATECKCHEKEDKTMTKLEKALELMMFELRIAETFRDWMEDHQMEAQDLLDTLKSLCSALEDAAGDRR